MLVQFARSTGQPLSEVLAMHPRDMDTWIVQSQMDEQDARFDRKHREQSGG